MSASFAPLADALRSLVADVVRAELAAQRDHPTPPRLLDIPSACAALGGLSRAKLYQLIAGGEIETIAVGRRRFVPEAALRQFINGVSPPGAGK